MSKTRKTKKQKLQTAARMSGFVIKDKWLKTTNGAAKTTQTMSPAESNLFRRDLTKTLLLTMLVLALELALWQYLTRH